MKMVMVIKEYLVSFLLKIHSFILTEGLLKEVKKQGIHLNNMWDGLYKWFGNEMKGKLVGVELYPV